VQLLADKNTTLAAACHGRDNNFNLLRFGAALAVFISHCPTIAGLGVISITTLLGYVAVNAFFAISGFLVAKSLYTRNDLRHFLLARALRVYPALIFAVIYTSLIVGLYFSSLNSLDYLRHADTLEYVYRNMLQLVWPIPVALPGVDWLKVNAPLWTLPFELHMYLLLALTAAIGLCLNKKLRIIVWGLYFTAVAISTVLYLVDYAFLLEGYGLGYYGYYLRFLSMFGVGVAFYVLRERVVLKTSYVIAIALLALLVSPVRPLFVLVAYGSLAYVLMYLAYVPGGFLRRFNKFGDYSYGIYIFAYPTQKAVMQLMPGINVIELFLIAFALTLLISAFSWHLLERPALGLKRKFFTSNDIKTVKEAG
jgi:peptidoglycan/LPS O-acetylase OafA/YrhL